MSLFPDYVVMLTTPNVIDMTEETEKFVHSLPQP